MSSQLSSRNLISDRYASALYDLSAELKNVDTVLKDFNLLQKHIQKHNDLKILVKSPLISSDDKLKIIQKILFKQSADKLTITFCKLISIISGKSKPEN